MLREFVERVVRTVCERAARGRSHKTFYGSDGSEYLTRYVLLDALGAGGGWKLLLHHFHRDDEDRELHNHPWRVGVSLMLVGGYCEERREGDDTVFHDVHPGDLNVIWPDTFHRVTLLGEDGWSVILVGPKVQEWGFWDRATGVFRPWRDFIRAKGLDIVE